MIDRVTLTWFSLAGAMVAAVVGSFSSLQGLLIWPAGLVLLYHRRRRTPFAVAWIVAAVISAVVYFYNFDATAGVPHHIYFWRYPFEALKFYIFVVGDVVGVPRAIQRPGQPCGDAARDGDPPARGVDTRYLRVRHDEHGGGPIGVALICVGLIFAGTVTAGRIAFGYFAASQSRYTTYDLLIPIGITLALLGRPIMKPEPQLPDDPSASDLPADSHKGRWTGSVIRKVNGSALPVARWVVAVAVVAQVVVGLHYGIVGSRDDYAYDMRAVPVLKNINHESDSTVLYSLDFSARYRSFGTRPA